MLARNLLVRDFSIFWYMRQTFLFQGSCLSAWCSDFAPARRGRDSRSFRFAGRPSVREPYGYWHSAGFAPAFPKAKTPARDTAPPAHIRTAYRGPMSH